MRPYNLKVWAHPLEDMDYQWIAERVALPSSALPSSALPGSPGSWGANSRFRYPETGGTGHIWHQLAARLGNAYFRYRSEVTALNHQTRELRCADGKTYRYRRLISTLPLDKLAAMLGNALPPVAQHLAHSSTHIVGLGLHGQCPPALRHKSWIYFPEGNCPFYRATVFSNYSNSHTPDPSRFWSLMTETSESAHKPVNAGTLAESTIKGAIATGLIPSKDAVCSVWQYRATHGYPVPTLKRDAALAALIPALENMGIYSRGRFGGWKYEVSNQDHSFMQGVELAGRLLRGTPETTYRLAV